MKKLEDEFKNNISIDFFTRQFQKDIVRIANKNYCNWVLVFFYQYNTNNELHLVDLIEKTKEIEQKDLNNMSDLAFFYLFIKTVAQIQRVASYYSNNYTEYVFRYKHQYYIIRNGEKDLYLVQTYEPTFAYINLDLYFKLYE